MSHLYSNHSHIGQDAHKRAHIYNVTHHEINSIDISTKLLSKPNMVGYVCMVWMVMMGCLFISF
ncbi:hypothetical protein EON63_16040 [archaeon]|nr:MAG: hypothetical protein EON63_16040 [archaeon]